MHTMTLDQCLCRSTALQDIYANLEGKPWWKEVLSFFVIADISESTCQDIRDSFTTCQLPLDEDGCVPKLLISARQLALDFSRMASNPIVLLSGQRRNLLRASEAWEQLAEDLELVSTKEKREAWTSLVSAAGEGHGKLRDWRDSDLFQ